MLNFDDQVDPLYPWWKVVVMKFAMTVFDLFNLSCILYFISAKIKLLCGADMLESFAVPDLWSDDDVSVLLKDNTCCTINARKQTNQLLP